MTPETHFAASNIYKCFQRSSDWILICSFKSLTSTFCRDGVDAKGANPSVLHWNKHDQRNRWKSRFQVPEFMFDTLPPGIPMSFPRHPQTSGTQKSTQMGLFGLPPGLGQVRFTFIWLVVSMEWNRTVPGKYVVSGIFYPPIGNMFKWYIKWYILRIGGLYTTYHLFREPETTDGFNFQSLSKKSVNMGKNVPNHPGWD